MGSRQNSFLGATGIHFRVPGSVLLLSAAAGAVAYGLLHPDVGECLLRSASGLPCPLCGATGALEALGRFQLPEAFLRHAPIALLVCALVVLGAAGIVSSTQERRQFESLQVLAGAWGWGWLAWYSARVAWLLAG